jgi:hypothetical protein
MVLKLQCFCFVILWIVWPLPHTTAIRNICLICGALLGMGQLFTSRDDISLKNSWMPLLLASLLFLWIHFHLFYLSSNWNLQWGEYSSLWKAAALSFIFGVGLTFSLLRWGSKRIRQWLLGGLLTSVLIYFVKFLATTYLSTYLKLPEYLLLFKGSAAHYVPKISYVFFLVPILAILLALIFRSSNIFCRTKEQNFFLIIQTLGVISIFCTFILENIKNGILYSSLLVLIYFLALFFKFRKISRRALKVPLLIFCIAVTASLINFYQNQSWQNFYSDFKIAIKVDEYSNWRNAAQPIPLVENGKAISGTNYDRISWGIIGWRLLKENPLGYGLVDRSFRHLAQKDWTESSLAQSHSGWLDFALGMGIPGVLLVQLTLLFGLRGCREIPQTWKVIIYGIVVSVCLIFITTEVSQNIYISGLFLIMGGTIGFSLAKKNCTEIYKS